MIRGSRSRSARAVDVEALKELVADDRIWITVGTVDASSGESHYEIVKDDDGNSVDVIVELRLTGAGDVSCSARLASFGGLADCGIWRIPPPGTEVIVAVPDGDLVADPTIIAILSSNKVPDELDETTLVVQGSNRIRIEALDGDVEVVASGQVSLQGGDQPIARKTDPVNMGTFVFVPMTSLMWTPPGGGAPVDLSGPPMELTGEVKDGSSKASSG